MEQRDTCLRMCSIQLDGGIAQPHVERRLGAAVAGPAAKPVVGDAANPRRDRGDARGLLPIQQWQQGGQQPQWPECIHTHQLIEGRAVQIRHAPFRSNALGV